MFNPFAYDGPKSAERLEDERYVRWLQMYEGERMSFGEIAKAENETRNRVGGVIKRCLEACDKADIGRAVMGRKE